MRFFQDLEPLKVDPIFGLSAEYALDTRKQKVNFIIGYFKDEELKTPIFKAIKKAEEALLQQEVNKEYLPIEGDPLFLEKIQNLVLDPNYTQTTLSTIQTIGGTGALSLLSRLAFPRTSKKAYISDPSWPNHAGILQNAGYEVSYYPYYDFQKKKLKKDELFLFLNKVEPRSLVLFQVSCHNPSGLDPSLEDWKKIAALCKKNQLLPLLDLAYQGLGEGLKEDAASISCFMEEKLETMVAYSCSKSFGIYGERVGAGLVYCKEVEDTKGVLSHLKKLARTSYSNPSRHGALLVAQLLRDTSLRALWEEELLALRKRLLMLRKKIKEAIESKTASSYNQVEEGKGMFFFTGLNEKQILFLKSQKGIYLTWDGRMNLSGLSDTNFSYVMESLATALKS